MEDTAIGGTILGDHHSIVLWDLERGRTRDTLKDEGKAAYGFAFSPDGKLLASSGKEEVIRLWDVVAGRKVVVLEGHCSDWPKKLAFSPDGKVLASAALKLGQENSATEQGLPAEADHYLTIRKNLGGEIKLWDPQTGKLLKTIAAHSDNIEVLLYTPDGKCLISGSKKTLIVWDTTTWNTLKTFGVGDNVLAAAVSPDGKLLAVGSWDNSISIWKIGN
jgi:WD40 repeat protein